MFFIILLCCVLCNADGKLCIPLSLPNRLHVLCMDGVPSSGALAAPRFCDSIAGESLRSATTTAGRNCASSTAGRNCASSTTGRNCASSTAGRSSASSTPTFSCTGTDVGTSDSGAAVVPETGELGAEAEAEEEAERAFEVRNAEAVKTHVNTVELCCAVVSAFSVFQFGEEIQMWRVVILKFSFC